MRVHFLLFLLLLILLPVQAGKHFWPNWSFVHGIRVDYLSPTFFLTDVLVFLVLAFWFSGKPRRLRKIPGEGKLLFFGSFGFLLLSVLLAARPGVALYKLLKLVELGLFGFYVSRNLISEERFVLAIAVLTGAVAWSSLLAWAQFWFQSSLSSVYFSLPLVYSFFQLLGERTFDVAIPGIAKARWGTRLVLRPYATFSHPNVLAGFITVVFLLALANLPLLVRGRRKRLMIYYLPFIALSLTTLLITFSRSAWVICFFAASYWFLVEKRRETKDFFRKGKRLGLLLVALSLMVVYSALAIVFPWFQALRADDILSVQRRIELAKAALRMVAFSPLWGVGLGNFIPRLFDFSLNREVIYWLQPVHNIFLLVAAETGLTGLGFFLWFLVTTFKRLSKRKSTIKASLLMVLVSVLSLGFFDHYFCTLQSAQLLFAFLLGLSWARIKKAA